MCLSPIGVNPENHSEGDIFISAVVDRIVDVSIECVEEFNAIDQDFLYLPNWLGENALEELLCWFKEYPYLVDKVTREIDLTIAPRKYLGHALKLLQYISEVIPDYKLPSNYVKSLWDILDSSNCDAETKTIAGSLLLRDCSGTQIKDRQEAMSKVLNLYSKQEDLTSSDAAYLKDFIDKHEASDILSDEKIDLIKKALETSENTSNKKVETEAKDTCVIEPDEKEVEYQEIIDPGAKKPEDVFEEFLTKNPEYSQGQDSTLFDQNPLYQAYQKVEEKFKGESIIHNNIEESFKPICKWNKEDISVWSSLVKDQSKAVEPEFLPELIAVIKQANVLASKGQFFRIPQVLSLITFLDDPSKGMLQEIKTGEGKSTITAALAVIQCLMGHKVDIVTSVPNLAERDAKAKEKFFGMFGLSVAFNSSQESRDRRVKSCYKADVVYGDTSAFQYDWIHSIFENNVRGKRPYDIIIVDEVDSMCIDEMSKLAMVSSGIPGAEFLYNVYCAVWKHLSYLVECTEFRDGKYYYNPTKYKIQGKSVIDVDDPKEFEIEYQDIQAFYQAQIFASLQGILRDFDALSQPKHLIDLVNLQIESWVKSIFKAIRMEKNKDYIIALDYDGYKSIAPVDHQNTGMVHMKTQWSNGVHQFLQIKEQVAFRPESLITRFISNLGFFKLHQEGGRIYGMTGTIGDENTQELLSEEYGINIAFIPTFKESKFKPHPGIIAKGSTEHLEEIYENIAEQTDTGRAVLVICEDIAFVNTLKSKLSKELKNCNIKSYSTGGKDQKSAIEEDVQAKDIIVATNLAGRGTDLKTSLDLEANGGLHVIITFLPKNARVEAQAFGRTARQGNNGSGIMIVDLNSASNFLELDPTVNSTIDKLKDLRNEYETFRINENKAYRLAFVKSKDKIFKEFCATAKSLDNIEPKQKQLEQIFGEILKDIENKQTFGGNFENDNISTISPAMEFQLSIFKLEDHRFYSTKNETYYDSLYKALSHQIGYKLSSAKIKTLLLYKIAAKHMDGEASDDDILQELANTFECTVQVFTNDSGIKKFTKTNPKHTFYISAFKNDYTSQVLYQSLVPNDAKDLSYVSKIIQEHKEYIDKSDSITKDISAWEKKKADAYHKAIDEKVLRDFNKLLQKQIDKYNDKFMIMKNPSFLVCYALGRDVPAAQALVYLSMAKGPHDYEPVEPHNSNSDSGECLSKKHISNTLAYKSLGSGITEAYFTHPAYYNYAWILIKEKSLECGISNNPKVKADYMPQAYRDLSVAYQQIKHFVLPNLQSAKALFNNLDDNEQLKQIDNRIELYERYLEHIQKVQDKIKNCSKKCYITISNIKTLEDFYPPGSAPMSEISELASSGLFCIFDVKESYFSTNWGAIVALCAVACFQLWAGYAMIQASMAAWSLGATTASFGLSTFTCGTIGFTLVKGGIKDLLLAGRVADGEPLDMDSYLHEKGLMIGQVALQIICDQLWKSINNNILGKEVSDKSGYIYGKLGPIGTELVNETLNYIADDLGRQAAEDRADKINASIKRKTEEFFNDSSIQEKLKDLFAQDEINKNQENYREIMTALINTFRSKQSVLSNIISAIIKGNGIDHPVGTILKVGQHINDGLEIEKQIQKLEEITAKALGQIKNTINNLHAQDASARSTLKNYLDQINLTNQDQIIARLEELGILVGQKVVKANIPSDPRDITGLGLSLNKLYDLKAKLNQIADAYSADYTEHFKGIRNQCDELLGDYCTGQTRIIGSKITGEVMGLAKNFALSRIEKKAAEKAKEAELERQAQQKAIDETDPWHQYREQSEKMNRIRTQTQHRKQSAVHDAKNQTVVLDTSSHNDGPPDFDKTFWAKITTKSNDNSTPNGPVKRMHVGHLLDPFNNGSTFVCRMSYPKANSAPGSMTFATESDKDTWMRNTGQLPINIPSLDSTINKDQIPIVAKQDPIYSSIVGYSKPEAGNANTNQNNSWLTPGNFSKATNTLYFMFRYGGKAAAVSIARASLAEGALALGGTDLAGGFIIANPELWIPVGLAAAWYYKDDIIAGCKALGNLMTSENQTIQPEFNSSGRVEEISKEEYDVGRSSDIITVRPEYRVVQGPSLEAMGISKPASKEPASAISTPDTWSKIQTPTAAPKREVVDDIKPLAISTPAATRFSSIANISTTLDPKPQKEPLPPFVPPYHIPEINLFQKCPIKLEARDGMRTGAKAAITEDMCPDLTSLSNQELAQKLVDIACGVPFHSIFDDVSKRVGGIYKHTHLKDVNDSYSAVCKDPRFEAEVSYKDGIEEKAGVEGSIRVDLRTIKENAERRFEVYDLKTGIAGINQTQIENYKKHLPDGADTVIYAIRPGGGMPLQVYP